MNFFCTGIPGFSGASLLCNSLCQNHVISESDSYYIEAPVDIQNYTDRKKLDLSHEGLLERLIHKAWGLCFFLIVELFVVFIPRYIKKAAYRYVCSKFTKIMLESIEKLYHIFTFSSIRDAIVRFIYRLLEEGAITVLMLASYLVAIIQASNHIMTIKKLI